MELFFEVEGAPGPERLPAGDGAQLVAFMSFAVSRGFGAAHPLIALADRLHDSLGVRLGPLTTFYDGDIEDGEDREKLELAWQEAGPLRAALTQMACAIERDPQCAALCRRAGSEALGPEAQALASGLAGLPDGHRVRLSYRL